MLALIALIIAAAHGEGWIVVLLILHLMIKLMESIP